MVSSRLSPLRRAVRALGALPVLGSLVLSTLVLGSGSAWAGSDDFEYGQKLAQNRHFKLARRLYEDMLSNPKATDEQKDLARFGLATLGYEEARSAGARADVPFAEVVKLYDAAAQEIESFATKNPGHPKAKDAKLHVGLVRLSVALWCRELVEDADAMTARKTSAGEVAGAAREAVAAAVSHFEALRTQQGDLGQLADYHWTMCQYYRALVLDPCSGPQIDALKEAERALDEYIMNHDGELLAVFAQDVLGQALAERAKCASNPGEKSQLVSKANGWFETCIDTDHTDDQTLTIITNGFLHFGQNCLAAGRIGTTNFARIGADKLSQMLVKVPTAGKTPGGLRALIVLGDLQKALGNQKQAVETWTNASDRAAAIGQHGIDNQAKKRIQEAIGSGSGGGVVVADVSVLKKAADSLFNEGKLAEALNAYRGVVAGAPPTAQGFVEFAWPAWERMAKAYETLGDPLSAAMAYEAVYDAWKAGSIPVKSKDENDANMKRAGNNRLAQIGVLDTLATRTGSKVFKEEYQRAKSAFATDFPLHPASQRGVWVTALERFRAARDAKRERKATWRQQMEEVRDDFLGVARDLKSESQDAAWNYVVTIDLYLCDGAPDDQAATRGLAAAKEAQEFWASAPARQKLTDFPQLGARRKDAELGVAYQRCELLKRLSRWDEVIAEALAYRAAVGAGAERADDALALVVEAHIRKGAVEEADRTLGELLSQHPKHLAIPALVSQIANRFDDQYRELTKQFVEKDKQLRGTKEDRASGLVAQLAEAQRELNEMLNFRVTLNQGISEDERRIAGFKADPESVKPLNAKDIQDLEERVVPEAKKKVAEIDKAAPVMQKKRDDLAARVKALQDECDAIIQAQYQPLKEAVKRYHKGLEAQLANDPAGVEPSDALSVGTRWYFAARNANGQPEDWDNARKTLEIYLGLEAVKALPGSHPDKRSAVSKLGRVYSHLSEKEADPAQRASLVQQAITMLEGGVAARPENNEILVGLLSGRYGQVIWENDAEAGRPAYRFIVPKAATAAELKAAIQRLGAPDSPVAIPVMGDAARQAGYRKGLAAWKEAVAKLSTSDLEAMHREVARSGVDTGAWRDLGRLDAELRLSLAQAYAQSGADADAPKGEALLATLLRGPIAAEASSDDWWEAQTTAFLLFVSHSERIAATGNVPAKASEFRKRAAQLVRGVTALTEIPTKDGVRAAWKDLLARLNKGLRSEGSPEVVVDLDRTFGQPGDGSAGKETPK